MRVLTQSELSRFTKAELFTLLRRIAGDLPDLKEGSSEAVTSPIVIFRSRHPFSTLVRNRPRTGPLAS